MNSDIRIGSIVIHCFEFEKTLNFWKAALGYRDREPPQDDCMRGVHTLPFRALKTGMYPEANTLPKQHTPPDLQVRLQGGVVDWAVISDPRGKGPNLSFQKRDRKRKKRNWIHLDLYTKDRAGEVKRLCDIGAKPYEWRYPSGADYVVLEDPDGNLFCVVEKAAASV